MAYQVRYEWSVERSDEFGDIYDSRFFESRAKAEEDACDPEGAAKVEVCLVRDVGNDLDGLVDRQWAYLENGRLPDEFTEGAAIPKRFRESV